MAAPLGEGAHDMVTELVHESTAAPAGDVLLSIYEVASRIRQFDWRAHQAIARGEAFFAHYGVKGQELIPAAVSQCLGPQDQLITTYRGIHDEIAKGVPLEALWGEALGKRTGASGGKGGPMHPCVPEVGMLLSSGIVAGGIPVANGVALASQLRNDGRVTVCNFGDGATNQGAFHEAMNLATLWNLPVVFICQNNQYAEHTAFAAGQRNRSVVERAAAYGMRGVQVDGNDAVAMYNAAIDVVAYARSGQGPVLLECLTWRLSGHVIGDENAYMDPDEVARRTADDPLPRFRAWLIARDQASEATLTTLEERITAEVEAAFQAALAAEEPPTSELLTDVCGPPTRHREPDSETVPTEQMRMGQAIRAALDTALASDERVIILGEDIADSAGGGVYTLTSGLSTKYGEDRVRNTPISESAIIGAAIGASLRGLRPIAEIMMMDFLPVCFDQVVNHAAKIRYMSAGRSHAPMTIRVGMLGGNPVGAQHQQTLEAMLLHVPGLRVVYPSTGYDAKGLLASCIEDDDPCVFIEAVALLAHKGLVPTEDYRIPLGVADVKRPGSDVSIITYGRMVRQSLKAADSLEAEGVSAEVLDLRSLSPLDVEAIAASAAKTGRVVVAHEAVRTCGVGAEVAAVVHEQLGPDVRVVVRRVTSPDVPAPAAPSLQAAMVPTAARIAGACRELTA
jgi:pyruvate/2-oxoglutarate/acetoin dehydrogenase E1 component/TPP-dependent pyruvate/acetoin dehydrogenase alpha subunit